MDHSTDARPRTEGGGGYQQTKADRKYSALLHEIEGSAGEGVVRMLDDVVGMRLCEAQERPDHPDAAACPCRRAFTIDEEHHAWLLAFEGRGLAGAVDLLRYAERSEESEYEPGTVAWMDLPQFVGMHQWRNPADVGDLVSYIVDSVRNRLGVQEAKTALEGLRGLAAGTLASIFPWYRDEDVPVSWRSSQQAPSRLSLLERRAEAVETALHQLGEAARRIEARVSAAEGADEVTSRPIRPESPPRQTARPVENPSDPCACSQEL